MRLSLLARDKLRCFEADTGVDPDDLASRLRRIRDGDTPHPPLNLEADDDHAIEDLARRILAAGSDG